MKITFEGKTIGEILDQVTDMIAKFDTKNILKDVSEKPNRSAIPLAALGDKAQGPGPDPFTVETPVDKPVDKPVEKPGRTAKQLENDERLRARAAEKAAEKKAAKAVKAANDKVDAVNKTIAPVPPPKSAEDIDPAELVKIRQQTIDDLQAAYANGFQQEVFALLSVHGNGAKSFRELSPEAFLPIREAIDLGALTNKAPV